MNSVQEMQSGLMFTTKSRHCSNGDGFNITATLLAPPLVLEAQALADDILSTVLNWNKVKLSCVSRDMMPRTVVCNFTNSVNGLQLPVHDGDLFPLRL